MALDPNAATARYIDSLGPAALQKAHDYTLGKEWMVLWALVAAAAVTWLIVRSGLLDGLERRIAERRRNLRAFVVSLVFFIVSAVLTLPWTIYESWRRGKHRQGRDLRRCLQECLARRGARRHRPRDRPLRAQAHLVGNPVLLGSRHGPLLACREALPALRPRLRQQCADRRPARRPGADLHGVGLRPPCPAAAQHLQPDAGDAGGP